LNKLFKRPKIKFSSITSEKNYKIFYLGLDENKDDVIIVSGIYDYCKGEIDLIKVEFYSNYAHFLMSEKQKTNLVRKITTTIIHESRHKYHAKVKKTYSLKQYKIRNNVSEKMASNLQYYANADEIDAYAYETKVDCHFGKLNINMLRSANKIKIDTSESIFAYKKYFRKTDPKIWKKFLKKVYKNINEQSQII
jgi:hypothetical protein